LCAFVEIPNEEDKLEGAGVYADLGKCAVAGGLQEEELYRAARASAAIDDKKK
jgi:hypothetical protein